MRKEEAERERALRDVPVRGGASLCAGCRFGETVRRRVTTGAYHLAMWAHEHPEQPEHPAPRRLDETDSYCNHPRIAGTDGSGAKDVGVVIGCTEFTACSRPDVPPGV